MNQDRPIVDFAKLEPKNSDWVSPIELKACRKKFWKLNANQKKDLYRGKEIPLSDTISAYMYDFGDGKQPCFKFKKGGILAIDVPDPSIGYYIAPQGRIFGTRSKIGDEAFIDAVVYNSIICDEAQLLNNGGTLRIIHSYVPELTKIKGTSGKRIDVKGKIVLQQIRRSEMPAFRPGMSIKEIAKASYEKLKDLERKGRQFNANNAVIAQVRRLVSLAYPKAVFILDLKGFNASQASVARAEKRTFSE